MEYVILPLDVFCSGITTVVCCFDAHDIGRSESKRRRNRPCRIHQVISRIPFSLPITEFFLFAFRSESAVGGDRFFVSRKAGFVSQALESNIDK